MEQLLGDGDGDGDGYGFGMAYYPFFNAHSSSA